MVFSPGNDYFSESGAGSLLARREFTNAAKAKQQTQAEVPGTEPKTEQTNAQDSDLETKPKANNFIPAAPLQRTLKKFPCLKDIRTIDPNAKVIMTLADLPMEWPAKLKQQLLTRTKNAQDAAFLILNSDPQGQRLKQEGRGIYVQAAEPGLEKSDRKIYIKGTGSALAFNLRDEIKNEALLEPAWAEFPAFGGTKRSVFFDNVGMAGFSSHPRTLGTETNSWGKLEFVGAAAVLNALVKKYALTDIKEIRDRGLTIPIAVTNFPKLSKLVKNAVATLQEEATSENERSQLSWSGNQDGVGSVALEVPSDKRISLSTGSIPLLDGQGSVIHLPREHCAKLGKTFKELLSLGYLYSAGSSHKQNIYDADSTCPQADNSDLICLGSLPKSKECFGEQVDLPEQLSTLSLITASLDREFDLNLEANPQMLYNKESLEAREAFWAELFPKMPQERLKKLLDLMPLLAEEIKLVAAQRLYSETKSGDWRSNGETLDKALSQSSELKEEYVKRVEGHISVFALKRIEDKIEEKDLQLSNIEKFFASGEESLLSEIPGLTQYQDLLKNLDSVSATIKTKVLHSICRINSAAHIGGQRKQFWLDNRGKIFERVKDLLDRGEAGKIEAYLEKVNFALSPQERLFYGFDLRFEEVCTPENLLKLASSDDPLEQLDLEYLQLLTKFKAYDPGLQIKLSGADQAPKDLIDRFRERGLENPLKYIGRYLYDVFENRGGLAMLDFSIILKEFGEFFDTLDSQHAQFATEQSSEQYTEASKEKINTLLAQADRIPTVSLKALFLSKLLDHCFCFQDLIKSASEYAELREFFKETQDKLEAKMKNLMMQVKKIFEARKPKKTVGFRIRRSREKFVQKPFTFNEGQLVEPTDINETEWFDLN